jgi:hypothetical protein
MPLTPRLAVHLHPLLREYFSVAARSTMHRQQQKGTLLRDLKSLFLA